MRFEVANIDSLAPQSRRCRRAKIVLSAGPDEDDASSGPRSRHRLIRPLPASGPLERSSKQRFSGRWKALADNDEVCIGAAEQQNSRC